MPEVYEARVSASGQRVKSASVSLNLSNPPTVQAEVYGELTPESLTLELLKGKASEIALNYPLAGAGSGGADLQTGPYRGAQNAPVDFGLHSGPTAGVENVPQGTGATLDDFYSHTTLIPSGGNTEAEARQALQDAGYSLVIIDGPGVWREAPEGISQAFEDTGTLEYLQSTLLKTGARWWLEGDTLTIDGSAAPSTFALPENELYLITAYSWNDETVELDEPVPGTPPDREDYLSQCPEYEAPEGYEPPERTPETIMQGVYRYTAQVGEGDERVEYERVNYYNGRLYKTELTERGNVNTPGGVVFKERTFTVTTFKHHPMCKEAVVKETTQTYAAPDMTGAGVNTDVEEAEATWLALGGNSMYLAAESVKDTAYHSSGYLKEELETIRELEVLTLREPEPEPEEEPDEENPEGEPEPEPDAEEEPVPPAKVKLELVYNVRTRQTLNEPNAGGRWVQYVNERQTENLVVYEATDGGDGTSTAAPARVQRNSRTTSRAEQSDGAPAQLNCSPPEPDDPDAPPADADCLERQEYEYQKALKVYNEAESLKQREYESRIANPANQSKRVHSLTFGVPRLGLKLGGSYGGGLIAALSHSYNDSGQQVTAGTSLTVWQVL